MSKSNMLQIPIECHNIPGKRSLFPLFPHPFFLFLNPFFSFSFFSFFVEIPFFLFFPFFSFPHPFFSFFCCGVGINTPPTREVGGSSPRGFSEFFWGTDAIPAIPPSRRKSRSGPKADVNRSRRYALPKHIVKMHTTVKVNDEGKRNIGMPVRKAVLERAGVKDIV